MQSYSVVIIIALILFSIYRRVRRTIGWQELNSKGMMFRVVLFLVIGLIFLVEGALHPVSLISDIVGVLLGIILAVYSAGMTRFEQREKRWYYRPNTWIGSIVTALFIIRFIFRFSGILTQGNLSSLQSGQQAGMQNFGSTMGNSWTAGLMLIMFAYYVIYYMILIRKQKQLGQAAEK
jgi:disulfide bond formation protein DsbB